MNLERSQPQRTRRYAGVCLTVLLASSLVSCQRDDEPIDSPGAVAPPVVPTEPPPNVEPATPTVTDDPAATAPVENAPTDPGRDVELSVNGERVTVNRPSLANPFVVAGGEFDEAGPTAPSRQPEVRGPTLQPRQVGTIDVIRRVPQNLELGISDPDGVGDVVGYYVRFEGYPGTFYVPTEIDSEIFGDADRENGRTTIGFFMDEVFPPGSRSADWGQGYHRPFDVNMQVWAVDRAGRTSAPIMQPLHVLPVGTGDLEVTLSMSQPTDLDLYVVEPNGNVIYYANMHSYTQGRLDLDANAACERNQNVRYEHIFWPAGQVPEGRYQIRVDNWANCVGGQDVDYEVIINNCGDISVHQGSASGWGGRDDCVNPRVGSCQAIADVEVRRCEVAAPVGPRAPLPM